MFVKLGTESYPTWVLQNSMTTRKWFLNIDLEMEKYFNMDTTCAVKASLCTRFFTLPFKGVTVCVLILNLDF